jgi:hypothetical protein
MNFLFNAFLAIGAIGFIGFWVGFVWIIVTAFKESKSCGLLSIFVPYYFIYYGITRRSKAKRALLFCASGISIFIMSFIPLMILNSNADSRVESVMSDFVEAASAQDINVAYSYWAPGTSMSTVSGLISKYQQEFQNVEKISKKESRLTFKYYRNMEITYNGNINHTNGQSTKFGLIAVGENDSWKIKSLVIGNGYNLH